MSRRVRAVVCPQRNSFQSMFPDDMWLVWWNRELFIKLVPHVSALSLPRFQFKQIIRWETTTDVAYTKITRNSSLAGIKPASFKFRIRAILVILKGAFKFTFAGIRILKLSRLRRRRHRWRVLKALAGTGKIGFFFFFRSNINI